MTTEATENDTGTIIRRRISREQMLRLLTPEAAARRTAQLAAANDNRPLGTAERKTIQPAEIEDAA